jgi:pimeloyl-ACP methyl ester carboxylesterase
VLLLHGWGGSSAQLAPLAGSLVARGFRVVAVDAPAHGLSSGWTSSMPQFARAALEAARRLGPFRAVVGHSMGGAALALALRDGLAAERAVFIGTPRNPVDWTRRFAEALGVGPRALLAMKARSERRLGFRWDELDMAEVAPHVAIPLLVVHDTEDREVPFAEGETVAGLWRGASLVTTQGLGHNRILRDPGVGSMVAAFVAGASFVAGGWSAPKCASDGCDKPVVGTGALCHFCDFERELFDPRLRSGVSAA